MVDDTGLLPWLERMRDEVPGAKLLDAHTQSARTTRTSTAAPVRSWSRARADRRPGDRLPHARAGRLPARQRHGHRRERASGGRLFPFCRLDPADGPLEEARRALDAGARGIKLHPRAEGFTLSPPGAQPVFELAHERRLPILCHAGRGIPALGRHSIEVCSRYPGLRLILAHAGDLRPVLDLARGRRPPQPVLRHGLVVAQRRAGPLRAGPARADPMASDAPYATPAWGATMALRHGFQVGLSPEVLRELVGGQALRLLEGEEPLDLGPPRASSHCPAIRSSSGSTRS